MRVVLSDDYTGPGSGLDGTDPTMMAADPTAGEVTDQAAPLPPPQIITAGSDDPECVN